jgi:HSP20 family protein
MVFRSVIQSPRYLARFGEDPFATIQRAIERTLNDSWSTSLPTEAAAMSVRVDVREDEKAYHVTADLPGLTEKDVDVTFDDGLLTIRGEKKVERDEKKDTWHVIERSQGSFARQLSLPANIDHDKIEAVFDKGVLNVTLPKQPVEQTTAKKITIKAA